MTTRPTSVQPEPDTLPMPTALDAERSVLAAMMLDGTGDTARRVAAVMDSRMLWQANHRTLYEAIRRLVASGVPSDLVTLVAELERRGELGMVGGPPELSRILEYATTTANTEHHARIVRDAHVRREIIRAADAMAESARRGDVKPEEAWDACRKRVEETAAPVSDVDELLRAALDGPAFMAQQLDAPLNLLGDGLLPSGTLGMLHAGSGAGKTFLAEQLAHAVAAGDPWLGRFASPSGGVPVVLVQLEVSPYELKKRRLTRYPGGTRNLHTLTSDAIGRNINVMDPGDFERIARLVRGTGAKLVIFDPAQELHGDGIEDNAAFHLLVRQLKLLMLKTGVAILLVHHEPKAVVEKGVSRSDLDSARGGTRLSGACKLQMRLKRSMAGHWSLSFPKVSFGPKPADVPLAQTADGWWDATEAPVPQASRTYSAVKVYLEQAAENGATYADLERATGVGRNPVRDALDKLAVERGLNGWADLNRGSRQSPRFVLPAMSCESAMSSGDSQQGIDW